MLKMDIALSSHTGVSNYEALIDLAALINAPNVPKAGHYRSQTISNEIAQVCWLQPSTKMIQSTFALSVLDSGRRCHEA